MYYRMKVAGLERDLPICPVNENLYIAGFVIFGDQERLYAVAASGNNCSSVMISNPSCEDIEIEISTDKIPSRVLITTDGSCEKEIEMPKVLPRESFICIIYQ